jgi:tetratricopeptide (TPR) repeat protein
LCDSDSEPAIRWHLALVDFYARSDESAIQQLLVLAGGHADVLLVARAKNSIGYLMLLDGRLAEAEKWFADSSSLSPELATPRINLGYLLLVEGKEEEAEHYLRRLLNGADKLPAERDRVLARLALGLSLDGERKYVEASGEYNSVLRDIRGVGAVEVAGSLAPALVRLRLAKEVYLRNRDYYATEVWGAVMLGSSCRLLCSARNGHESPLFAEIQADINQNVHWIFAVAAPRPELLQYRNGVLSSILPRVSEPCSCKSRTTEHDHRSRDSQAGTLDGTALHNLPFAAALQRGR